MTQKEIDELLSNTKVYVAGKSKDIQEKLFYLGWNEGDTDVILTECPFLYIDNNHHISYGSDMCVFSEHKYREISAEEILSIELTKPEYRPFNGKKECWQEMLKHKPFGWIKDSQISHVISSVSFGHIRFYNNACNSFEEAFNNYRFADGTPFGIKED